MNELTLVQKVWNYAHVLRDQGVPYQAYISQISYLLFLKMDDERAGLVASGLIKGEASAIPEDCRWPVLRDLQGEELTRRYTAILDKLSRLSGIVGTIFLQAQNEIQDPAKLRRLVGAWPGPGSRSALSRRSCRQCRRAATACREWPCSAASIPRPAGRAIRASGNPRGSPRPRP